MKENNLEGMLREAEKYRQFVENVRDTIWLMDLDLKFSHISSNVKTMRGYTAEEAMALGIEGTLTAASYNTAMREYTRFKEHETWRLPDGTDSLTLELEQKCKDGSTIWTEVKMTLLSGPDDSLNGILGVTRDISDRKKVESALIESEKRYRNLYNSFRDGIIMLSENGQILDANPSTLNMLKHTLDELRNINYLQLVPHKFQTAYKVWWKLIKYNKLATCDCEFITSDKTTLEVTLRAWLIKTADDKTSSIWMIIRDISKRKQSEEQLRTLASRLIEIQEEERRNIARELHDQIGQSLNIVKILLDRATTSDDKYKDLIGQARPQLAKLIDRVSNLSLELRPKMLDDLGLVPALKWYFDRFTTQTNIRVKFNPEDASINVPGRVATGLYRVVQEALTNIARHAHATMVTVDLKANRDTISLDISDNGIGFDLGAIDVSLSGGIIGMQERVRLLGGILHIQSEPGDGTHVIAEMPCHS